MNSVQFECPYCHAITPGDESLYGQEVECPMCHERILVLGAPVRVEPRTARLVPTPVASAPEPRLAQLIQKPEAGAPLASTAAGPEVEVFRLTPVARAYAGQLLLGVVLIGAGIALAVLAPDFSWPRWAGVVPLLPGLIVLLVVWGQVNSHSYRLTTQRLFVRHGLLARRVNELELYRVKDVVLDQGVMQRLLGYGTITVLADDDSTPAVQLVGVAAPATVKETIRTQYRAARQREGVRPTEFLQTP